MNLGFVAWNLPGKKTQEQKITEKNIMRHDTSLINFIFCFQEWRSADRRLRRWWRRLLRWQRRASSAGWNKVLSPSQQMAATTLKTSTTPSSSGLSTRRRLKLHQNSSTLLCAKVLLQVWIFPFFIISAYVCAAY